MDDCRIKKKKKKKKHIINEHKQMITLHDLENKIATSASRQFEYNAVKSAFENACAQGIFDLENEDYDYNIAKLTVYDRPLETYTVKHFRKKKQQQKKNSSTRIQTMGYQFLETEIKHRHRSQLLISSIYSYNRNTSQNTAMENPT